MTAARATDADGEVALAFGGVVRDQVEQQVRHSADELVGLRKGADVVDHRLIVAGHLGAVGQIVWVRQEANVEDEIGVDGDAVFESEAFDGNGEGRFGLDFPEAIGDQSA